MFLVTNGIISLAALPVKKYTSLQQLYSNVILWNKINGVVFTKDVEFCTSERHPPFELIGRQGIDLLARHKSNKKSFSRVLHKLQITITKLFFFALTCKLMALICLYGFHNFSI